MQWVRDWDDIIVKGYDDITTVFRDNYQIIDFLRYVRVLKREPRCRNSQCPNPSVMKVLHLTNMHSKKMVIVINVQSVQAHIQSE